ncbi:hypothetical protein NQ315_013716 [Exocentrus adspersus]|uniref:Tc1-like transposase DDE domain-containing protein n=1 Tax=Exocentrus adspersus TaxID=1586481 RepID=A0AAV8W443_9CUCU|nr:hypothetical protein NQ315_013716 [Exocentrus adspersus]
MKLGLIHMTLYRKDGPDYNQDTTAELFENWFKNSLLVNIPKNSIIVMDNATYHSCLLNKVPNATNNTKAEIQEYIYKKRQLLQVLGAFNIKKEYVCDRMAEEMGHTVLRLPPYFCIFNPIEHIWHKVKSRYHKTWKPGPESGVKVISCNNDPVYSMQMKYCIGRRCMYCVRS